MTDKIQLHLPNGEERECSISADENPQAILIQLVERKEVSQLEDELELIRNASKKKIIIANIKIIDWCKELMPWNDEAVDRRPESGTLATGILNMIELQLIPTLHAKYGKLPCIIGGYSLGALFSLWAATQSTVFYGVAAASPSVWIKDWMKFAADNPIKAQKVYMSLGDSEHHTKNKYIKQVANNIREFHQMLVKQLSKDNTILEWNQGGHFQDFAQRTARAFSWVTFNALLKK